MGRGGKEIHNIYKGECNLNRAVAYLIRRFIFHSNRKPRHCKGVTTCITEVDKEIAMKIKELSGQPEPGLLVIDREKDPDKEEALEKFIEKHNCQLLNKHKRGYVEYYKCTPNLHLITLKGPPEDTLKEIDPDLRKHLSDPKNFDEFKKKAFKAVKNGDCDEGSSKICKGVKAIYRIVADTIKS